MFTPIIDNPNKPGSKRVMLLSCASLMAAVILRKRYTDEHFLKTSIMSTKGKNEAVTSVAIERLKERKAQEE